jgi:hypothetical protein
VASARRRTRRDDGGARTTWRGGNTEAQTPRRTGKSAGATHGNSAYGKCTIAAQWRGRAILFDLFPPDGLSCRGGTETRVANPEGRSTREVGLSQNVVVVLAVVFG